jgi:hypothetical protein
MEVKDVPATVVGTEPQSLQSKAGSAADDKGRPNEEAVLQSVANTDDRAGEVRDGANQVIQSINVAADAAAAIDRIVHSISGIVEQASSASVPSNRLSKLQDEANSLVAAIKAQVASAASGRSNPLLGDPIRLEVEQEIGRTLDFVLPEHAKNNFGLGAIDLSRKELILSVRTSIERAQRQLDEIKKAVGESRKTVEMALTEVDVALQNAEAAHVNVRDLERAMQLVGSANSGIRSNPQSALDAYSGFSKRAIELLE